MNKWIGLVENYSDYRGFVYIIVTEKGKWYCGQKSIFKGGKHIKKRIELSKWKSYHGSSNSLNKDIEAGCKYKKYVLLMCKNKVELNYFEAKMQLDLDVLYRTDCYNGQVRVRCGSKGLGIETNNKYNKALLRCGRLIKKNF